MRKSGLPSRVQLAGLGVLLVSGHTYAATVLVDDFFQPNPEQFYVVSGLNADPLLHKTANASILGGERDLLVDVVGTSNPTSATGTIGGGSFDFGSSDPVIATMQYDGIDADQLLPTRALVNGLGLGADLTGGGTNTRFELSFANLDAGAGQTSIPVSIALTGPAGATASFAGSIFESATAFDHPIPFGAFTTAGGFTFGSVTSITLTLNGGPTRPDVDFELDNFAAVPEPAAISLFGIAGASALRRRRF